MNPEPLELVIPSVHLDLDMFWAHTFGELGHRVNFLQGAVGYDPNPYDMRPVHPAVRIIGDDDYLAMPESRMVIFTQCIEHEADVYERVVAKKPGAFVVHTVGNNVMQPGRPLGRCPKNLLTLDLQAFSYWQAEGVPNIAYLQPGCDSSTYEYAPIEPNARPQVHCYIEHYQDWFPRGWAKYQTLRERLADAGWRLYGSGNPDGYLISPDTRLLPDYLKSENVGCQLDAIRRSWLTVHIKEWEGYGFNVVKSLMVGRPIVTLRDFISDKTLQYLCVDGVSAIVEDSRHIDRLAERITRYLRNPTELADLCESAARHIRHVLDESFQLCKLDRFLAKLVR